MRQETTVVGSDIHFPYQSRAALSIFLQVIKAIKPNNIIINGDLVDAWQISKFLAEPTRINDLQSDINQAKAFLKTLRQTSPKSKITITEGNHENRLRKTICLMSQGARELAKLDSFQEAMTWPSLLGLGKLNIGWIPEHQQPAMKLLAGVAVKHGTIIRKYSSYSARAEFENVGISGISGHTHRLGAYYHRNYNGQHQWFESGCLCELEPDYCHYPNWQNGFLVITTLDGKHSVEQIHIEDGSCMFRGEKFTSTRS